MNKLDPGGNATVYKDTDDDGDNEYYGQVNPGEPGYDRIVKGDRQYGEPMPSDWVDLNTALRSVAGNFGSRQTLSFGNINLHPNDISKTTPTKPYSGDFSLDQSMIRDRALMKIWNTEGMKDTARILLEWSLSDKREYGLTLYRDHSGEIRVQAEVGGIVNGINFPVLTNTVGVLHTHWFETLTLKSGATSTYVPGPSPEDISFVRQYGIPGIVVQWDGMVYGYR